MNNRGTRWGNQKTLMGQTIAVLNRAARLPESMQGKKVRNPVQAQLVRELAQAAEDIAARHLSWGDTGCLSARLGADSMLISRDGAALRSLNPQDWLNRSWRTPSPAAGEPENWALHRAVYAVRPEVGAILFAQPPFSTLLVSHVQPIPPPILKIEDYWQKVAWIPREQAGKLDVVAEACRSHPILLLQSRGVMCWASSARDLVAFAQTIEEVAQIIWFEQIARPR